MSNIKILDKEFKPYIYTAEIECIVKNLGAQLSKDLEGKKPLFLAILNGSFMFASDLMKEITIPVEISFIKVSSYEKENTTGCVKNLIGLEQDLAGRTIVILEDIIDTGITMQHILETLKEKQAADIKVCTFFYKPDKFQGNYPIDYIGKSIPNDFIVGYGLDYDGLGRNLKDVYQLCE